MSRSRSAPDRRGGEPLLEVSGLSKYFRSDGGLLASLRSSPDVEAVDDVSLDVYEGETLALVGESGCGKSTLARTILQLEQPTAGSVRFRGRELTELSTAELRPLRQDMMMIFQDPQSSLNPRMKVGAIVEEPMKAHDLHTPEERTTRAQSLLETVGLDSNHYDRYPHEFSGGQRQRINLARALSTDPELIMCDEPVSALDVSVQAQVLNTMREIQEEFGVTYLFISHDLSVVRYIADRVAVMYLGHIAELAEKEELFENPQHPYTEALLGAIPVPDPRESEVRGILQGDVPSPTDPPSGCRFRTRCPKLIQPGTHTVTDADLSEAAAEARLDRYNLSEPVWRRVLEFTRVVRRREFTVETATRQRGSVYEYVEGKYFDGELPGGEVGETIDDALVSIENDEWDDAAELLVDTFEEASICAAAVPDYEVPPAHGTQRHFAACHLHRD